jgi:hypothetical protein
MNREQIDSSQASEAQRLPLQARFACAEDAVANHRHSRGNRDGLSFGRATVSSRIPQYGLRWNSGLSSHTNPFLTSPVWP